MPPDEDSQRKSETSALGDTPSVPPADAPQTLHAEAESLLRHLKDGAARAHAVSPPGEVPLVPNYELIEEIGRGGMGVVFKARHATLRHTVAVKMILTSAHAAPAEVARFLAEAEAIAAVKHPNVVQVYDLGSAGARPYFVMEYVEGGNLAGLLKAGRLDPRAAAALLEPVARGVHAAHEKDIVHRDLKPANILLRVESRKAESRKVEDVATGLSDITTLRLDGLTPKVSDFGLAKRLAVDLTRTQAVMGTPQYMAPEQAGGKAKFVGPAADVYALGVILYECLTGSVPFAGDESPWSIVRQVIEDPPEPPRKRVPGVPRDLELICLKCLEKEPHHRYPTAAALADDLNRFRAGEPVSVRPIGPITRAARWAKRRPTVAGALAVGALLALVLPPFVVWAKGRYDQREADAIQAGEREEAAKKLAAAAQQAEIEANRAKGAAEGLAEARELFGLRTTLRNRAAARALGWTGATKADLPRALALARGEPDVTAELRSDAVEALLAADLFPLEPTAKTMTGSALATDPKTGRVAVGEYKSRGNCRVLIIDPTTGEPLRTLNYQTEFRVDAQDGTRALAFSPDGTRLFVGTRASNVFRFDLDKPENTPAKSWSATALPLDRIAVSPDGKTVYGLTRPEGILFAWDVETGTQRWRFASEDKVALQSFAVLPSGDLFTGTNGRFYHLFADGSRAGLRANVPVFGVAVVGTMMLLADGPRLAVYHRDTVEPTDQFSDPGLRRVAHEQYIKTLAVHPSGAFVATACGDADRTVKVWQLASGRLLATVSVPGSEPIAVTWSNDGSVLLATAGRQVARWRFDAGAQRFACFSGFTLDAIALPGARAAALGELWNGRREVLLGAPGAPVDVAYFPDSGGNGRPGLAAGPDGTLAATVQAPGIMHWRPGSTVPPLRFTNKISWCPRFNPDGREIWALVDSKEVQRFDPSTTSLSAKWRNKWGEVISGLSALDALAVGRAVAVTGGAEGTVFVLDPKTCEPTATFQRTGDPILSVALTPDDALAVAGTQKGDLRVIRVTDRTELPSIPAHPGGVIAVTASRDGALLATGGRDRTVRLWKRAGDKFELLFAAEMLGTPRDLQFSATDNRLIVLFGQEHAVRVWDVDRLKAQLAELGLGW